MKNKKTADSTDFKKDFLYLLTYLFFVLCFVNIHYLADVNMGDDAANRTLNAGYKVLDWAVMRYQTWSSRFLQEVIGTVVLSVNEVYISIS